MRFFPKAWVSVAFKSHLVGVSGFQLADRMNTLDMNS